MSEAKNIYEVEDIQRELHISRSTAYALCKRPDFPAVRISPRRIVIPRDALYQWLHDNAGKAI